MDQRVFSRRYTWSHGSGATIICLQTTTLSILTLWQVNWEQVNFCHNVLNEHRDIHFVFLQDYESIPPSICLRNSTDCGQGNVPLYAILAESVEDVQVIESLVVGRPYTN